MVQNQLTFISSDTLTVRGDGQLILRFTLDSGTTLEVMTSIIMLVQEARLSGDKWVAGHRPTKLMMDPQHA